MRIADFEAMVVRMAREVPAQFFDGIIEVVVSPRSVPHPEREEIYTLGECVPVTNEPASGGIQSRIVLYYGSFAALARLDPGYDWRSEAWETLTHELRHHLEWRADAPDLEAFDRAAEQNFARADGDRFDPAFHLDGERVAHDVYRIDDDFFIDRVVRALPASVDLRWHGRGYRVRVPAGATLPAYLTLEGVSEPPPGELLLVLRQKARLRDLFRVPPVFQAAAEASPL